MRIISWNCNGALRKKLHQLVKLDADIHVVQECEDPAQSKDDHYKTWAENYIWVGSNKNKGLGVFASKDIQLSLLKWDSDVLEYFLPCRINGAITLLAVWTRQANSPTFGYIGQMWKYLQKHKLQLPTTKTILCGDLNSNARWDVWDRWWNHSDVVMELEQSGIKSLYHYQNDELQGKESQPTFYMYRKLERPYHIDYAFLSSDLLTSSAVSIGKPDEWLEFSDHMPVVFTID
ncbi:MAG: endonuclease/exonuclease/phosphatase family protein [Gallionellaceae bacterium]